jgi:Rad3-related DNA helicase
MSYKEKDTSFPYITKMIGNIINMYKGKRGIVQTGSYSFAKQLKEALPDDIQKRVLLYEDSAGKQDNLEVFKYSTDKILIGPSLVEGLSLNDDLCRFQIIMKVPYPSLADKFISAKRDFNPQWYSDTTTISVLQGVGRGVRSERDWCVTFILDGCFNNLLSSSRSMFPQEFIDRIQIIPSSTLLY